MKRIYRLKSRHDFKSLFRRGRRHESPLFKMVYAKNDAGYGRFAFIAAKSVSSRAVKRNTLRRRAREWVRKQTGILKTPADIAIIFKKEADSASRKKFYEELEKLFKKSFGWCRPSFDRPVSGCHIRSARLLGRNFFCDQGCVPFLSFLLRVRERRVRSIWTF